MYGLTEMLVAPSNVMYISVNSIHVRTENSPKTEKVGFYQFLFKRTRRETSVGGFFTTM